MPSRFSISREVRMQDPAHRSGRGRREVSVVPCAASCFAFASRAIVQQLVGQFLARARVKRVDSEKRRRHQRRDSEAPEALDRLPRNARSTLLALNIERSDEAAERSSPIASPNASLENAVRALPEGGAQC